MDGNGTRTLRGELARHQPDALQQLYLVRHGWELPQRRIAGDRTLYPPQPRHAAVRGDDDRSEGVYSSMDHSHDHSASEGRRTPRLRMHGDARRARISPHMAP